MSYASLPAIGYEALCTYALLGVSVVVFADVVKGVTGRLGWLEVGDALLGAGPVGRHG